MGRNDDPVSAMLKRRGISVLSHDPAGHRRMQDKIAPFFESAVAGIGLHAGRLRDEAFSMEDRVFITDGFPDMAAGIGAASSGIPAQRGSWSRRGRDSLANRMRA